MKNHEQSVWKFSSNEWRLFYDIKNNSDLNETYIPDIKKSFKLGSLVMTPKGIGRLLHHDEIISKVKFINSDEQIIFDTVDISTNFYIFLKIFVFCPAPYYRIELPANGDVDTIRKVIANLNIFKQNFEYSMMYNSKILNSGYFDQLDFKKDAKILVYGLKKEEHVLKRYSEVCDGWYSSTNDSIVFNVDRKISICGLGYYGSNQNKTIIGNLKILELSEEIENTRGRGRGRIRRTRFNNRINDNLLEMRVEIPPVESASNCIHPIRFKKITISPNVDYFIEMEILDPCDVYYGTSYSTQYIESSGVTFKFLSSEVSDSSSPTEGNFPEIYYYV
jgi:hypothetical protein